jgi:hypothetical protein
MKTPPITSDVAPMWRLECWNWYRPTIFSSLSCNPQHFVGGDGSKKTDLGSTAAKRSRSSLSLLSLSLLFLVVIHGRRQRSRHRRRSAPFPAQPTNPNPFLAAAYQDVRSDKTDTNWLLLDYEVCIALLQRLSKKNRRGRRATARTR